MLTLHERVHVVEILCENYKIEPALVLALFDKETGGTGFCGNKLKINFEQGVFNRSAKWHKVFVDKYGPFGKISGAGGSHASCRLQPIEYQHLERAKAIHLDHAFNSTGMGIAQTQGWEAFRLGYGDSVNMFNEYSRSEAEQIKGFFLYLQFARGGKYPMFGPQKAPLSYIGPNLEAMWLTQKTGDMYHFAVKYRGNAEMAQKKYAPELEKHLGKWKAWLAANRRGYDRIGLKNYKGYQKPKIDYRGVSMKRIVQYVKLASKTKSALSRITSIFKK